MGLLLAAGRRSGIRSGTVAARELSWPVEKDDARAANFRQADYYLAADLPLKRQGRSKARLYGLNHRCVYSGSGI